jgi:hypothetical protein
MARRSRTAILKRQREVKKAEKAAAKREKREARESVEPEESKVATADDLKALGFYPDSDDERR